MNNNQNSINIFTSSTRYDLAKKMYSMTEEELKVCVMNIGKYLIEEVRTNKIELNTAFEKFADVWFAIPNKCDAIIAQSLVNFKDELKDTIPEYSSMNRNSSDLKVELRKELAEILARDLDCTVIHREYIIHGITDYPTMQDRMHKARQKNTGNILESKLKNN